MSERIHWNSPWANVQNGESLCDFNVSIEVVCHYKRYIKKGRLCPSPNTRLYQSYKGDSIQRQEVGEKWDDHAVSVKSRKLSTSVCWSQKYQLGSLKSTKCERWSSILLVIVQKVSITWYYGESVLWNWTCKSW